MIISHEHEFIFVKTRKVGGSSLQHYLSRFLGPDDVATALPREGYDGQNWEKVGLRHPSKPQFSWGHASILFIIQQGIVTEEQVHDYNVFTIERNPWDKTVSNYHFLRNNVGNNPYKGTFENFVRVPGNLPSDWNRYTINDQIVADYVFPYENLNNAIEYLFTELIPIKGFNVEDFKTFTHKSSQRPDKDDYRSYYDDETQRIVERHFEKEIEMLNYTF